VFIAVFERVKAWVDVFEDAAKQANPGDCKMLTKSAALAGHVTIVSKHAPEMFPVSSEFSNLIPRTNGMVFPFFAYLNLINHIYTFWTYTTHWHTELKTPILQAHT
jgi:hypothetical protein